MKKSLLVVSLFIGATLLVWGCMGKNGSPISPTRVISLSVTASNINSVRAKLLGASQNVMLYRIDGTSGAPVTGSVGPFSTSGRSRSYTFTIPNFISNGNSLLSLQLNDASTGQALAIGAARVVSTSGVPIVTVELGSIGRPCYDISGAGVSFGYAFGFSSDNIVDSNSANGAGLDIAFDSTVISDSNVFRVKDASTGTSPDIAFLGNGNLVDFDVVPADSAFQSIGGVLHTGDVFFVKLSTIPNAHAWIQITNPGSWGNAGPSPSFVYRVSTSKSYYAYETTVFDQLGGCSGAPVTNTFLDFTLEYGGNSGNAVDATHQLVGILNTGIGGNSAHGFQSFTSNNAYVSFGGIPIGYYAAG